MSLQENIKKKIFVPPLNHSGGGHFGCPPPELLRRGTILRGGTVPPLKLLRGGDSPLFPPPVSALAYVDYRIHLQYISVKSLRGPCFFNTTTIDNIANLYLANNLNAHFAI